MALQTALAWLPEEAERKLKAGDAEALIQGMAAKVASLYRCAGSVPNCKSDVLEVFALGGTPKAGMLAAAIAMRDLLAQSPKGRQALLDFGFEAPLGGNE